MANDFWHGDFRKLFEVDARCGLAIVHTRVAGKRGLKQADETVRKLHLQTLSQIELSPAGEGPAAAKSVKHAIFLVLQSSAGVVTLL